MSEYYAVVRSGDHLAHYGVKGMKWGVRRALINGNEKALDRHFRKAAKKLKKLQDIGLKPAKYAAKSAAYGVAAAGTGTIAIAGTEGFANYLRKKADKLNADALYTEAATVGHAIVGKPTSVAAQKLANKAASYRTKASKVSNWGNTRKVTKTSTLVKTGPNYYELKKGPDKVAKLSNNDWLRLGAGAATLGLGAASAVNAYRAKNSKKYRQKAIDFKKSMDETFAGTKYSGKYVAEPKRRKRKKS